MLVRAHVSRAVALLGPAKGLPHRRVPRLARAVADATGCDAVQVRQNNGPLSGQTVFHVHVHIIPKFEDGSGLTIEWNSGSLDDGEQLAQSIASSIE